MKVVCNLHLDSAWPELAGPVSNCRNGTDQWLRVVERPDIDVIWIGTNPHLHAEITIASLDAGKHVFCQARMARDVAEARRMRDSARLNKDQVTMLCPPPNGMKHGLYFRELIQRGKIGTPYHFSLRSLTPGVD